jgi:hypothetical protein
LISVDPERQPQISQSEASHCDHAGDAADPARAFDHNTFRFEADPGCIVCQQDGETDNTAK